MSTTAVIGFGILAWALSAILLALFVARMIRLRDRQRPDGTEPDAPAKGQPGDGTESSPERPRWRLRNKT